MPASSRERCSDGRHNPDKLAISNQVVADSLSYQQSADLGTSAPLHCGTVAPLAPSAFRLKAEATLCGSTRIPSPLFGPGDVNPLRIHLQM